MRDKRGWQKVTREMVKYWFS